LVDSVVLLDRTALKVSECDELLLARHLLLQLTDFGSLRSLIPWSFCNSFNSIGASSS
jgi:hypothetical protein